MQAQGGPSRAELWDTGRQSTPDSHLWPNTPVQTSSPPPKRNKVQKKKKKAVLTRFIVRKHLSLRNFWMDSRFLPVGIGGWKGGEKWGDRDGKTKEKKTNREKKPTFEMYTFKKTKLQYTVYPIAHWSCRRIKIWSVGVALKQTDPSCAVLTKVFRRAHCEAEAKPSLAVKEDEHTLIT